MSAIKFFGEFDTKKLVEQIKASSKNFKEWANDVVKDTAVIDRAIVKNKDTVKTSISEQKEIMKQMEQNLVALEKAYEKATAGKQKMQAASNLRIAKADLEEEKNYVKQLEAQYEELKKKKSQDIGDKAAAGLKSWAAGLITAAAAMKIFKEIIASTTTTAEWFNETIAAGKAGLTVLMKAIATGDFTNFGKRVEEAQVSAKAYTKSMEEISNKRRELDLKELDWNHQIEEQRTIVFEDQNTSDEKKLAAIDKMRELYHKKAVEEIDLAKQTQEAVATSTSGVNVMTKEQLEYAIANYDKLVTIGAKYNTLQAQLSGEGKGTQKIKIPGMGIPGIPFLGTKITVKEQTPEYYANVRAEIEKLGKEAPELGKIVAMFGEVNSKERDVMSQAMKDSKAARNLELEETRKLARFEKGIRNSIIDDQKAATKAKNEFEAEENQRKVDNAIEIQQTLLNTEKDGTEKRVKQAELDYVKYLNDLDKRNAEIVKKRNIAAGGIIEKTGERVEGKYVPGLAGKDLEQDSQLRIAAEKEKNAKIVQIYDAADLEIKRMWDEVENYRLEGIEKEKAAVKKKYDDEEEALKKLNNAQLSAAMKPVIADKRKKANIDIDRKYALEKIDLEQKTELAMNNIHVQGDQRSEKFARANFETFKKYQQQKIDLLRAAGDTESINKADELQAALDTAQGKEQNRILQEQIKLREQLVDGATRLFNEISQIVGLDDDMTSMINDLAGVVKQFASGDKIGGIISYLVFFFKTTIKGMTVNVQEFFDLAMKNADDIMKKYGRIIQMTSRTGMSKGEVYGPGVNRRTGEAYPGGISQNNAYIAEVGNLSLALEEATKWQDYMERHANTKKGFKQLDEAKQKVAELTNQLEDAKYAYQDFLLGGITEGGLADTIAQAFNEGKTSIDDFSAYMTDTLKAAAMEIFKMQYLLPEINKTFMPLLKDVMSDNKITEEEKKKLDDAMKAVGDKFSGIWEDLAGVLDDNSAAKESLSGMIARQLTEETGSELAGLMRRQADDIRSARDVNKQGLSHLINIEANTLNTVTELKNAVVELKAINSNTKPQYAGAL